jgi:hypothetical protein
MKEVTDVKCASNLRKVLMQTRHRTPRDLLGTAALVCMAFIGSSILATAQTGQLDATFGSGGLFETNVGTFMVAADAIALQSDGKIVVSRMLSDKAGVLRLNSDGVPASDEENHTFGHGRITSKRRGLITRDISVGNNSSAGQF